VIFGSNPFAIGAAGLVVEPGPGLTRRELAHRATYLARAAIGSTRRAARVAVLSLARRGAAELARLVSWRAVEVEALAAVVAPVPAGRAPPGCRSAVTLPTKADPCELTELIAYLTEGPPSVTPTNEKASELSLRGPLSIFRQDHSRGIPPLAQCYQMTRPARASGSYASSNKAGRRAFAAI
jgi:hypothetical protein